LLTESWMTVIGNSDIYLRTTKTPMINTSRRLYMIAIRPKVTKMNIRYVKYRVNQCLMFSTFLWRGGDKKKNRLLLTHVWYRLIQYDRHRRLSHQRATQYALSLALGQKQHGCNRVIVRGRCTSYSGGACE